MEQAFPEIVHPFSRKGAYFFEKRFQLEQRNKTSRMMLCLPLFLETEEKSGLLLAVTAKMLQKYGVSRVSSNSARLENDKLMRGRLMSPRK
jgi:hypothetical protein